MSWRSSSSLAMDRSVSANHLMFSPASACMSSLEARLFTKLLSSANSMRGRSQISFTALTSARIRPAGFTLNPEVRRTGAGTKLTTVGAPSGGLYREPVVLLRIQEIETGNGGLCRIEPLALARFVDGLRAFLLRNHSGSRAQWGSPSPTTTELQCSFASWGQAVTWSPPITTGTPWAM